MSHKLSDRSYLSKLLAHLDACKDVCDSFGIDTVLVPYAGAGGGGGGGGGGDRGFTVRSYRNPAGSAGTYQQGGGGDGEESGDDGTEMKFAPDPFWDDDEVWDFGGADDDDDEDDDGGGRAAREGAAGSPNAAAAAATTTPPHLVLPEDDADVSSITGSWVSRMMADLALCPFTQSSSRSGIPPGPVRYAVDRSARTPEEAYASYWSEVAEVQSSPESELSTTLHVLPRFCVGKSASGVESFEQWADTLTGTLGEGESSVDGLGKEIQLIFFHPDWTFRDGGRDRLGAGGMAGNYARRSPWPMVNILRTGQVRIAQRGIPTGLVYQQVSVFRQ
jgi:hypothetical protein